MVRPRYNDKIIACAHQFHLTVICNHLPSMSDRVQVIRIIFTFQIYRNLFANDNWALKVACMDFLEQNRFRWNRWRPSNIGFDMTSQRRNVAIIILSSIKNRILGKIILLLFPFKSRLFLSRLNKKGTQSGQTRANKPNSPFSIPIIQIQSTEAR